jgi:hypothetical protein
MNKPILAVIAVLATGLLSLSSAVAQNPFAGPSKVMTLRAL